MNGHGGSGYYPDFSESEPFWSAEFFKSTVKLAVLPWWLLCCFAALLLFCRPFAHGEGR
jgi:hypothetical protein